LLLCSWARDDRRHNRPLLGGIQKVPIAMGSAFVTGESHALLSVER
jgi:hypothetical protein